MIYECDNCDFTDEEANLPDAKELSMRLTPGGKYTDKECPKCGALCFPVAGAAEDPDTLGVLEKDRAALAAWGEERTLFVARIAQIVRGMARLSAAWRRRRRAGGACVQQEEMNGRADAARRECARELDALVAQPPLVVSAELVAALDKGAEGGCRNPRDVEVIAVLHKALGDVMEFWMGSTENEMPAALFDGAWAALSKVREPGTDTRLPPLYSGRPSGSDRERLKRRRLLAGPRAARRA